jgi:hypothetical protein
MYGNPMVQANCKLELKFAQQSGVPIIPVMMQPNFTVRRCIVESASCV